MIVSSLSVILLSAFSLVTGQGVDTSQFFPNVNSVRLPRQGFNFFGQFFQPQPRLDGTPCVLNHNRANGVCKASQNCPKAIQDWQQRRIQPTVCGWSGFTQIVCCESNTPAPPPTTTTTTTKRPTAAPTQPTKNPATLTKSERYCQEYQKYVYESVKVTALALDDETRERRVDRCGHKTVALIVGGSPAKPREFPHMALIGYGEPTEIDWACGGSLISDQWVVTAGHCSQTRSGPARHVRLGEFNRTSTTDDDRPENFVVVQNIPHPEYKSSSTYHDIALLQLDRRAKLSPWVRPICLPTQRAIREHSAIATGWGRIGYLDEGSDILLKVTLELFPYADCAQSYTTNRRLQNGIVDDTQLCAGSRDSDKDTCQGDSGGPLQVFHPNQYCMYSIIGVTSFGKGCGLAGTPAVYTRVHTFVPWIESIVWPN